MRQGRYSGSCTGIDVGSASTVTAIRYVARAGQVARMIGGVFEGSNTQAAGYVTLATVVSASDTVWTTMLVSGAAPYRYLRYRGPANGSCNVAEIEFHGTNTTATPPPATPPATPTDHDNTSGKSCGIGSVATLIAGLFCVLIGVHVRR